VSVFPAQAAETRAVNDIDLAISRNSSPIGFDRMRIERAGDDTKVSISIEMKLKLGFITLFHFVQSSSEHWHRDRLISLTSDTDNNGTPSKLALVRQGGRLVGRNNDTPLALDATIPPASLWTVALAKFQRLFKNIDGTIINVSTEDLGPAVVKSRGQPLSAHHYRISGDLNEDLWFSDDGLLARLLLAATDGSTLTFSAE
jgi:hypothetical protein